MQGMKTEAFVRSKAKFSAEVLCTLQTENIYQVVKQIEV